MTNQEVRFNESGYPIKECPKCFTDININSFNGDICNICFDNNIIKVWEITEGDYNDVFSRTIVKGNTNQIEDYINGDKPDNSEDLNGIGIGYIVYFEPEIDPETNEPYEDQEIRAEHYIEAMELEDYSIDNYGKIEVDLTEQD